VIRLGRSRAKAAVEVAPAVVSPTESIAVTVTLAEPLDRVAAARVRLGYVNRYGCRWAGRRDAALRHDDSSLLTLGQVGTDAGSDRNTEDWVGVLDEELPFSGGTLEAGSHEVALRIPSWAPGSSESIVRWVVRLQVRREGRGDVELEQAFTVLAPPPAAAPEGLALERLMGGSSEIVVDTERAWYRAGEQLRGTIAITPDGEVPEADVGVLLQRVRASHPLERTPGEPQILDGGTVQLDKHLLLPADVATKVPFTIEIPADADPTSEAVHSSLRWFVQVRILYKGFNSHVPERVRREFVLCSRE
jgi:hypothetical protein